MSGVTYFFWICAAATIYVYLGYPLMLWVMSRISPDPAIKRPHEPTITIVIAAYNEVAHIAATVQNKLALDYPKDKLQIIVVSDGSTDGTDASVQPFTADGVVLLRQEPRNGKTAALNRALLQATGDLIVFADANSLYAGDALLELARNFADERVGYVTGKLGYLNQDGSMTGDGCSAYMRYENFIRVCESQIGSIVGVNGGIDAVRRKLYEAMHPDDLPDLVLPLRVFRQGYRVIYDPQARLSESANTTPHDEYRMRVRVALRALWTLKEMPGLMNVRRHGFYAIQLLSHKVLRYLACFFMVGALAASALLWNEGLIYRLAFTAQSAFAAGAYAGFIQERRGRPSRLLSIPYYFVLVNAAAMQAFVKFVKGERHRVWSPRLG